MLEKLKARYAEAIQSQISAQSELPPRLLQAAEKIVQCLLQGNKVIICGQGHDFLPAQLLANHLLQRYDMARPSFAAVLLQLNNLSALTAWQDNELANQYKYQLQAVAREGDLFIFFASQGNEELISHAVASANAQGLSMIAFTSSHHDHIRGLLDEDSLEIPMPASHPMRIVEGHLFQVNLLSETIDQLLFPQ